MTQILRLAGELILLYILYKLIFDFIIPVYQTTKKVKKQFGEMQNKMEEQMKRNSQQQTSPDNAPEKKPVNEDYIEYEEIKK